MNVPLVISVMPLVVVRVMPETVSESPSGSVSLVGKLAMVICKTPEGVFVNVSTFATG